MLKNIKDPKNNKGDNREEEMVQILEPCVVTSVQFQTQRESLLRTFSSSRRVLENNNTIHVGHLAKRTLEYDQLDTINEAMDTISRIKPQTIQLITGGPRNIELLRPRDGQSVSVTVTVALR